MQLPAMSRINKGLVITFVALFVFSAILGKYDISLANIIGLSSGGLLSGKIWTVLTYAFLPHGFLECLFDGLIFWFIGSELENMWGPRRYVYFLLTTILGAAFIFLLIGLIFFANTSLAFYPLSGPAGMASTMCVAYGVLFPERTMYFFFFPLQAKWFVILLVGMNLYHGFFTPGGLFAWAQIGAMLSGFLWMVFISNPNLKSLFPWVKDAGPRDPQGGPHSRSRKRKNKISHLHIVEPPSEEGPDDDDDTPPTYH
jgi:membrane associated rhomboid family serine protease